MSTNSNRVQKIVVRWNLTFNDMGELYMDYELTKNMWLTNVECTNIWKKKRKKQKKATSE